MCDFHQLVLKELFVLHIIRRQNHLLTYNKVAIIDDTNILTKNYLIF